MASFTSIVSSVFSFLTTFQVFGIPVLYLLVGGTILAMIGRYIRGKK